MSCKFDKDEALTKASDSDNAIEKSTSQVITIDSASEKPLGGGCLPLM